MIEIIANDRLGRKGERAVRTWHALPCSIRACPDFRTSCQPSAVRVKCLPSDTVGDLKKLIAAQTGTIASKIQLKKWQVSPHRRLLARVVR